MSKQKQFEIGTIQWLMMQAVEKRPEPYVIQDFLIFNNASVRFDITVKIIEEKFKTVGGK
jgi:hypothetical protein